MATITIIAQPDQLKLIAAALRIAAAGTDLPKAEYWEETPELEALGIAETLERTLAMPDAEKFSYSHMICV